MLKASNGGGGRGMRIVQSQEEMEEAFEKSRNESKRVFWRGEAFYRKVSHSSKAYRSADSWR
ncbi:MAG: hypothetical protein ACLR2D_08075 [Anaerobutyricum hallii]